MSRPRKMNKKDAQPELVPQLRFPEFREDGRWHPHVFADLVQRVRTSIPTADVAVEDYVSTENLLPDFGGVALASNLPPVNTVTQFRLGDTLLANIRPYLKKAWFATRTGGASNDVFVFRSRGQVDPRFLSHRIQSDAFIAYVMSAAKGVKMPRGELSHIEQFPLPIPDKKAEQQKIAACLGSLDDLIAAEGQRLATLRNHKKGLMQQLFPREGETRPRLRFLEFQDAPEWKAKSIEELCEILNNRRVPVTNSDRVPGPYPYYGASGIVDYIDDYIFDERLVLIGEDGAKWAAFEPTAFVVDGKYWVNNHAHVLKPIGLIDTLLASYLTLIDIGGYVSGAAPPKLTLGKLKTIPIPVPPLDDEQYRIAGCFASLDAMIAAQAESLDALRTHKRGLMQQLFPSPEGNVS